jgi:hypothetical protein
VNIAKGLATLGLAMALMGCGSGGGATGTGSAGASGSPGDVILGTWNLSGQKLDPDHTTMTCGRTQLTFAPGMFTYVRDGKTESAPVSSYELTGGRVHVNAVNDEYFTLVDHNTIQGIEMMAQCTYTRAG